MKMSSEMPAQIIPEVDSKDINFSKVLNGSLKIFFKDALKSTLRNPIQARYFYRTVKWQKKAAKVRTNWQEQGVHVPPIMIFSITDRCNLHCKGCYNQALRESHQEEMSAEKVESVIAEANELGISFVVIAGGEPLVREEIIDILNKFPEIIFLVFTNGLLIDDDLLKKLKGQNNFVPVISLEGLEEETDGRRGEGVYKRLKNIIKKIKGRGIFWSVSLTVTRLNYEAVTNSKFIQELSDFGCKLFFFLEYTPIKEGTEDWILTEEQREDLISRREIISVQNIRPFLSPFQAMKKRSEAACLPGVVLFMSAQMEMSNPVLLLLILMPI
jgi:MoaA/NifB/PqqE/SkfB family radical SAM enzyme